MTEPLIDPRNFIDTTVFPRLETLSVAKPTSFMRRQPRPSAAAETQLIFGERFHVHKNGRGWLWGQNESLLPGVSNPGYVGWVRQADLSHVTSLQDYKISALSAPVFSDNHIKSPVVLFLPMNSVIGGSEANDFLKTAEGFIHKHHVSDLGQSSKQVDWVAVAESLIGQPYVWGGVSSFGLDCSGLVQTALRAFGEDAPRDSDQQARMGLSVSTDESLSGLQRGDLIVWRGHVGIMTSPNLLLHANAHHMMVAAETLEKAASRIAEANGQITAIRRL